MHVSTRHAGAAAIGVVAVAVVTPLASAAPVPPGGLITSFVGNQATYCSIICPLLVQTGVTAAVTTLQTPATFVTVLQPGDVLKAIGATAASVTGPTDAAATAAIVADGTKVAPRALNAFETGVVGVLDVVPAATGGLPGIVNAIQAARQDTFTALHAPIVTNPAPTVTPHGVVEVAVVGGINVVAAVAFPAFNDALLGAVRTPDAVAQTLAATGDPVRAVAAGVTTAVGSASAAVTVIGNSVVTAVKDIRTAGAHAALHSQKSSTATLSVRSVKHPAARPLHNAVAKVRDVARRVLGKPGGADT